jgi:hypothetical protein
MRRIYNYEKWLEDLQGITGASENQVLKRKMFAQSMTMHKHAMWEPGILGTPHLAGLSWQKFHPEQLEVHNRRHQPKPRTADRKLRVKGKLITEKAKCVCFMAFDLDPKLISFTPRKRLG